MEARFDDYMDEIRDTMTQWWSWGASALNNWLDSWQSYVKTGGVRPSKPH